MYLLHKDKGKKNSKILFDFNLRLENIYTQENLTTKRRKLCSLKPYPKICVILTQQTRFAQQTLFS